MLSYFGMQQFRLKYLEVLDQSFFYRRYDELNGIKSYQSKYIWLKQYFHSDIVING